MMWPAPHPADGVITLPGVRDTADWYGRSLLASPD